MCAAAAIIVAPVGTVAADDPPPGGWYTSGCVADAWVVTNTDDTETIVVVFPPASYPSTTIEPGGTKTLPSTVAEVYLTLGAFLAEATVTSPGCDTPTTTSSPPESTPDSSTPESSTPDTSAVPTTPATPETPSPTEGSLTLGSVGPFTAGDEIIVTGGGFAPDTIATLTLYSTPQQLAAASVPADGNVYMPVILPAVDAGQHRLVLAGTGADGSPLVLSATIEVRAQAPAAAPAALPATGAPTMPLLLLALLTGVSGAALIAATRPRQVPR